MVDSLRKSPRFFEMIHTKIADSAGICGCRLPPNRNSVSGRENRLKPVGKAQIERVSTRFAYQTMNSFIGFGEEPQNSLDSGKLNKI